uniref:Cell cycle control protein 50A n=1 Tax=Acrobeloides nanus TaxID=290746 RepID=A0A914C5C1_9BILA
MTDSQHLTNGINAQNGDLQYPPSENGSKQKKNRPKATRLRQQKLPAWQPILTAWTVIPTIFILGAVSIPIGVVLLLASDGVNEHIQPYDCSINSCPMTIRLAKAFEGDVYFYYGLENYFQNHRRYVKSRSDKQLLGTNLKAITDCEAPYDKVNGEEIVPCGAIANSMFNDTFELSYQSPSGNPIPVPWTYEGVVWDVDKKQKFRNPGMSNAEDCKTQTLANLTAQFKGYAKPINWQKYIYELDDNPSNTCNNGFLNTDFIVWMRTAALPTFRKPYRILIRNGTFTNGLPAGDYTLAINDNYPVKAFNGKKSFIISTTSWAGGRNPFLGISYIVVGSICVILGVIFLVVHLKFGHSLEEMSTIALSPR